jgi:hypothetical protein
MESNQFVVLQLWLIDYGCSDADSQAACFVSHADFSSCASCLLNFTAPFSTAAPWSWEPVSRVLESVARSGLANSGTERRGRRMGNPGAAGDESSIPEAP